MEVALGKEGIFKFSIGFVSEFGAPYFTGVVRHDYRYGFPLLLDGGEFFQYEFCVDGSAGAGDGNDNFVHDLTVSFLPVSF